jgi:hypothetical protein
MAQGIENERAYAFLPILGGLSRYGHKRSTVLLPQARRFDVAASSRRGPYPAFYGLPRALPEAFQDQSDSRRHWEHTACGCGFAMRD